MSSSRLKSQMWLHFTAVDGQKKVKCLHCGQELSVANKSTCSLIRHINKKHPTEDIVRQTSQNNIDFILDVEPTHPEKQEDDLNNCQSESSEQKTQHSSSGPKKRSLPQITIKRKRINEIAIHKARRQQIEKAQDENEFDLFCRSLAVQLKKMPLNQALLCQEKLQSVMVQERLSQSSPAQTEYIFVSTDTTSNSP